MSAVSEQDKVAVKIENADDAALESLLKQNDLVCSKVIC